MIVEGLAVGWVVLMHKGCCETVDGGKGIWTMDHDQDSHAAAKNGSGTVKFVEGVRGYRQGGGMMAVRMWPHKAINSE